MKFCPKILIFIFIVGNFYNAVSQIKGEEFPETKKDTVFIFTSPRQLINHHEISGEMTDAWGLDMLLSGNGFGLGFFYQKKISENWFALTSLYVSGARNTDELEMWDYSNQEAYIPGKIHRLFMIPVTLGVQRYLFKELLHENLKPFVNAGVGSSLIISTPYVDTEKVPYAKTEFFSSFGDAKYFGRFATFIGAGANVGSDSKALVSVNIRYYYIPFGGKGIESVKDNPITDFGGIFLSLSLGAQL